MKGRGRPCGDMQCGSSVSHEHGTERHRHLEASAQKPRLRHRLSPFRRLSVSGASSLPGVPEWVYGVEDASTLHSSNVSFLCTVMRIVFATSEAQTKVFTALGHATEFHKLLRFPYFDNKV